MTKFSNDLRKLLIDKISNHELDLPVEKIKHTLLTFEKVDGELRYFIDNDIVNKLTKKSSTSSAIKSTSPCRAKSWRNSASFII